MLLTSFWKKMKSRMTEDDIYEASLNRPSKVQIVLTQYMFDEDESFTGWECDIFYKGEYIGGGTAPTQEGVFDLANEIVWDHENPSLF